MSLFRPQVDALTAYIPGEQPQEPGWVKLNTNENPYPPSPRVVEAIQRAATSRLNVYPDPLGTPFRKAAAELFQLDPDWFLPGNGSDENLTMLVRSFADAGQTIAYPYPSYILYETLAEIQGSRCIRIPLNADWSWDMGLAKEVIRDARLHFVPNPNSPSGNRWDDETILSLIPPRGVLVLDEAYGDFADKPHRMELLQRPEGKQIVVTRTLSKGYSLAGIRFGFAIAHPDLIRGMRKVKESYNCDAVSIAAAEAAIRDQAYLAKTRGKILAARGRMTVALRNLGFHVVDSQTNFVWATRPENRHQEIYQQLKARKILVRYMNFPGAGASTGKTSLDGLRITVGTDQEVDTLIAALKEIV
jgi:histidinol-phosphate aminotransferase